jgi:hypothetical protein
LIRLAVAAYLAGFTGLSRTLSESDLRAELAWCTERRADWPAAGLWQIELYIRWT